MTDRDAGSNRPLILLVEDHADTRLMYEEFFGPDYDVRGVGDGIAALAAVEERQPDVVVTDLALPRMDGFELITRLRADTRLAGLPIIALSGYSGTERDRRIINMQPVTLLEKPCLPETLVREVEKHLRGKAGGQA
jgi:CheY-like chemotaxis protein